MKKFKLWNWKFDLIIFIIGILGIILFGRMDYLNGVVAGQILQVLVGYLALIGALRYVINRKDGKTK